MRVTQTSYTIQLPKELNDQLVHIVHTAAQAKLKNDMATVNRLKSQYNSLVSTWTNEMKNVAKKKSSGWFAEALGGGTFYYVPEIRIWEDLFDVYVQILKSGINLN